MPPVKIKTQKEIVMIYLLLLLTLCIVNNIHTTYTGEWANKTEHDHRIDYTPIRFYSEVKPYTTKGIAFTFPADYFTSSPHVHVSLQHDSSADDAPIKFYSLITELSASMVKVNVYKVNAGIIHDFTTEADSNEVIVHVLTFGY